MARIDETLDLQVMEVRSLPGLGMTIDVVLVNGTLRVNDFIILSGIDEPIVTMVRDLLMPAPLREIRVKVRDVFCSNLADDLLFRMNISTTKR